MVDKFDWGLDGLVIIHVWVISSNYVVIFL